MKRSGACALVLLALCAAGSAQAQKKPDMTFFVTSVNPGKGADLGGLDGADQHCQSLAAAVGAGGHTWRAYLSTTASGKTRTVNARSRIGKGPWRNAKGEVIARNLEELHGENNLTKQTALNEKGEVLNGRGDRPNVHDALTGQRQRALLDDLEVPVLGDVLHQDDDPSRTMDQVHGPAHALDHLAGDRPVGQVAGG